jgi:hypothetical protein
VLLRSPTPDASPRWQAQHRPTPSTYSGEFPPNNPHPGEVYQVHHITQKQKCQIEVVISRVIYIDIRLPAHHYSSDPFTSGKSKVHISEVKTPSDHIIIIKVDFCQVGPPLLNKRVICWFSWLVRWYIVATELECCYLRCVIEYEDLLTKDYDNLRHSGGTIDCETAL